MIVTLTKTSRDHAKVVFDILRIFLPKVSWQQLVEGDIQAGYCLDVQVENGYVHILFKSHEKTIYTGKEAIEEKTTNETKRTIKLAVYKALQIVLKEDGSSWGILTGIRPTKIVHRFWDKGLKEQEIKEILKNKFALANDKAEDLLQITKVQRKFLLSPQETLKKVGIYISIPFCPTKCFYCSFPSFSIVQWQKEVDNYIEALIQEITLVGQKLKQKGIVVETVYIGGGTPTSLNSNQLLQILNVVNRYLRSNQTIEFTVEAGRPDTITEEKLKVLRASDVGRISINPQTMWQPTLDSIGRTHTTEDIIDKFKLARNIGFKVINMDLIIGLPGENIEHLTHTLRKIEKLKPENVTFHALAIKRGAKLQENLNSIAVIDEMHSFKESWCLEQGYIPYYLYRQKQIVANLENIGYSFPKSPCLYNIQMMEERQTILGLGVGACSKIVNSKDWTLESLYNPKDILIYNNRIKEIIKAKVDKICSLG